MTLASCSWTYFIFILLAGSVDMYVLYIMYLLSLPVNLLYVILFYSLHLLRETIRAKFYYRPYMLLTRKNNMNYNM